MKQINKILHPAVIVLFLSFVILLIITFDFNNYQNSSLSPVINNHSIVMSIYSVKNKIENRGLSQSLGHSWIAIRNNTYDSIFIGDIEIAPEEDLSFSAWMFEGYNGVVFNLESYIDNTTNRYTDNYSASIEIEEKDLPKIDEYIKNNNRWNFIQNCSYWSSHLWNKIVKDEKYKIKEQIILYTPAKLIKSINQFTNSGKNIKMRLNQDPFLYYNGQREVITLC